MTAGFLLDTHAAVWLLEGSRELSDRALAAVREQHSLAISDISLLEVAMLERRGIIALSPDPAAGLNAFAARLDVLPISAAIARDAVTVALPHRDPFDRVIAATARMHGLTLISKDRQIREAGVVPTLW